MNAQESSPSSGKRELVRCNSCRATMTEGLFRCPHCGQVTTGTESKVTQLGLTMQMRARAAERKERVHCRSCGKATTSDKPLCPKCERKHQPMTLLLVVAGVLVVIMIITYFL